MVYVPPVYPGAIPTIVDLPDRADDIDWLYAARYNELKKELRAALIELGTDPAGTFATVKARLDALLPHFHDRGTLAAYDYAVGNFTTDNGWHDLDLSSIVPAGAVAVLLGVRVQDDVINSYFQFRKNGQVGVINRSATLTQVANLYIYTDMIVGCDANRVVEYRGAPVVFIQINVAVRGWWK